MVKFCTSCGTTNTSDARYCAKCGTAMAVPFAEPAVEHVDAPIKEEPREFSSLSETVQLLPEEPEPERNWLIIAAIVGSLMLIGGAYYWLFIADDIGGGSLSTAAPSQSVPAAAQVQLFTITDANIRDRPTTSGSTILGKLPRGSAISGVLKIAEDGSEWLELSEGKGFVATVNLVELQPPELAQSLGDRNWTADSRIDVYTAGAGSELLDSVSAGTVLKLSGLTADGSLEVKLPDGRIGYILQGKEILSRLGGKPIAIAFNPQTCNFGSELEPEFAKIGARLKAQWQALEDKEFADDAAREKAYSMVEGKSSYVKLARSFEGLSLSAIGQHYESQSLYFADPPAKVIEVFRAKGFRIDGNGNFPSTELYAGVSGTRGEGAAYGKTELGCGV
jgi:zinc-ribbon domain